jgi:hypothetical protein
MNSVFCVLLIVFFSSGASTFTQTGLAAALSELRLVGHAGYVAAPPTKSEQERYAAWEAGQADYLGQDAFANIQAKLDAAVQGANNKPQPATAVVAAGNGGKPAKGKKTAAPANGKA